MAGPKRPPGIDVAQVGHDQGLFPGSILISPTDRRAAAMGVSAGVCVCVCVCVCVLRKPRRAGRAGSVSCWSKVNY